MKFRVSAMLAVTAAALSFSSLSYAGTICDPSDKMAELGLTQEGKPLPVVGKTSIIQEKPFVSLLVLDKMSGEHELVRVDRPADFESKSLAEQADCVLNLFGKADSSYILPGMIYDGTVRGEDEQSVECRFTLPAMSDYNNWACGDGTGLGNFLTDALFANLGDNLMGVKVTFRKSASDEYRTVSAYMDKVPVMPQELFDDEEDGAAATVSSTGKQGALNTLSNGARPTGQLTGKAVYFNQGHGKVWRGTNNQYFSYQRGFVQENMEDLSNADLFNSFVTPYVWQAGADTYSVRETDPNPNMVIVDNDDAARTDGYGFSKTGTWTASSITGFKNGASPYVSGTDPFSLGTQLLAGCTTGASPTATATWAAQIPAAGWYNVYVSHAAYNNRAAAAKYQVFHAGGVTDVTIDQRRWRNTWVVLGRFYFEKNAPASAAKVVLSNISGSANDYVAADAVRFGGGRGVVKRGTAGTSGEARYNEEARYHLQFCGVPETGTYGYDASTAADTDSQVDEKDGWTARPRYAKWMLSQSGAYGATAQNSCMVAGHTNAFDTTARGFGTYRSSSSTANDVTAFQATVHPTIYNDLKGIFSGMSSNRGQYSGAYGENNPDSAGMPVMLGEWIFHDNTADMTLYHHPRFRQTLARGIMRGIINYWASKGTASRVYPPEPITNLCVLQESPTSVRLTWSAPPTSINGYAIASAATGYRIWKSEHGRAFPNALATMTAPSSGAPTYLVTGLTPGKTYYFKVTATNTGGESQAGDTLAVRTETASNAKKVLIVQGFNKLDPSTRVKTTYSGGTLYRQYPDRMNTYDYIFEHMKGIDAYCAATNRPIKVNSCNKDSINGQWVLLSGYDAVIWMSGIEAEVATWDVWNDVSIDSNSRTYITNYLNTPKKAFFLSGSEVAWEMVSKNVAPTFLTGTLKTGFTSDGSGVFTVTPVSGSIFSGIAGNIALDTGSDLTRVGYQVQWPDVLNIPSGSGASAALAYGANSSGPIAATQYGNDSTARVVFMGFPLETIVDDAKRNSVMSNTMKFLLPAGSVRVNISPDSAVTAGAQWSIDGGSTWNNSGTTLSNVDVGSYTVSFKSVSGWNVPATQSITVSSATPISTAAGEYTQATGALRVTLEPETAVTAGAKWSIDDGTTWHNSGGTLTGLIPGKKIVTYKPVSGWAEPSASSVTVVADQTATTTGTYTLFDIELINGDFTAGTVTPIVPETMVDISWTIQSTAAKQTPFWCEAFASKTGGFDQVRFGSTVTNSYVQNGTDGTTQTIAPTNQVLKTLPDGAYSLMPVVNRYATRTMDEFDYVNNWLTIAGKRLRVHTAEVASSDYVMSDMSVLTSPSDPELVTITGTIRNAGEKPLPANGCWIEAFYGYLSTEATLDPLDTIGPGFNLKNLSPGQETSFTLKGRIPVGKKNYAIAAIVDSTDIIPESNEANNSNLWYPEGVLPTPPQNGIDLTVTNVTLDPAQTAPNYLAPMELFNCSVTVKNNGTTDTGSVWIELFASQNGGVSFVRGATLTDSRYEKAPAPGESKTYSFANMPVKAIGDGMYTVVAVVNRVGAPRNPGDSKPLDNRLVYSAGRVSLSTPTQSGTVNLIWSEGPTFTQTSGTMTVTGKVKNTGTVASKAFWTEAFTGTFDKYMGFFTRDSVVFAGGVLCEGLAPDAEQEITVTGPVTPGKNVGILTDSTDLIAETDETDNYDYSELTQ